jgi:predicted RecB family nuclease
LRIPSAASLYLKALAIRQKRIHIVGSPEINIEGTPIYLDVEGLPDRDFYYLFGVRLGSGDSVVQHSLWADGVEDERGIWNQFLSVLVEIENPVLIHYGSYETLWLRRMRARYGVQPAASAAANALAAPFPAKARVALLSSSLNFIQMRLLDHTRSAGATLPG